MSDMNIALQGSERIGESLYNCRKLFIFRVQFGRNGVSLSI
jgi:hypothetical protein